LDWWIFKIFLFFSYHSIVLLNILHANYGKLENNTKYMKGIYEMQLIVKCHMLLFETSKDIIILYILFSQVKIHWYDNNKYAIEEIMMICGLTVSKGKFTD